MNFKKNNDFIILKIINNLLLIILFFILKMLSESRIIVIVWSLFFFEIIPIVVYIYNYGYVFSPHDNDSFLSEYKNKLENKVISPYYYIYEFERIFPHHHNYESDSEVENGGIFHFINYFFIVDIFLWLFSVCLSCSEYYETLFVFLVISEIVTLVGFINTLFLFHTNVDIPGINIYIFENYFNDEIRERLEKLYDIKVYCLISEFILLILFIIQMVCINVLKKKKKEEDILSKSNILKKDEIEGKLLE